MHPHDLGMKPAPLEALLVDSPRASAAAVIAILDGVETGPRRDHAVLNAAALIYVSGQADNLQEGVARALEAVASGAARAKLDNLVRLSQE